VRLQREHLDNAFPDRLALELLFNRNTLDRVPLQRRDCGGLQLSVPQCRSRYRLNQIAHSPEVSLNSRCHRRSAPQCRVTADEVVINEVQPYGCFEVIQLLAECQCKTRQPLNV